MRAEKIQFETNPIVCEHLVEKANKTDKYGRPVYAHRILVQKPPN